MAKIETGRFSDRLRRSLGMKGVVDVAGELSPEVSPVIVLEDNSLEWQFLQQVKACCSATLEPANAGFESVVQWLNPAGSGIIAVFSHVGVSVGPVININFGYALVAAALPTAGATAVRDHRWSTAADPTSVRVSRDNTGTVIALASSIFITRSPANRPFSWEQPVVLLPGEALQLGSGGSLALDIRATAVWTERALPALET